MKLTRCCAFSIVILFFLSVCALFLFRPFVSRVSAFFCLFRVFHVCFAFVSLDLSMLPFCQRYHQVTIWDAIIQSKQAADFVLNASALENEILQHCFPFGDRCPEITDPRNRLKSTPLHLTLHWDVQPIVGYLCRSGDYDHTYRSISIPDEYVMNEKADLLTQQFKQYQRRRRAVVNA